MPLIDIDSPLVLIVRAGDKEKPYLQRTSGNKVGKLTREYERYVVRRKEEREGNILKNRGRGDGSKLQGEGLFARVV